MIRIAVFPGAEEDIREAIEHYNGIDHRLGDRFEGALDAAFTILADHPGIGRLVEGREPLRRFPFRRFPHGIFYEHREELKRLDVLRVLHEARSSRQWPRPS